jgi:hypothetical protein
MRSPAGRLAQAIQNLLNSGRMGTGVRVVWYSKESLMGLALVALLLSLALAGCLSISSSDPPPPAANTTVVTPDR